MKISLKKLSLVLITVVVLAVLVFWSFQDQKEIISLRLDLPDVYSEALNIVYGQAEFSLRPLAANASPKELVAEKIFYRDAYAQTDIVQTVGVYKIKEDIILKEKGHPAEFKFELGLKDFEYEIDERGNINFFEAGAGESDASLRKLFTIPAPFMIDAAGVKSSVKDVIAKIEGNILSVTPSSQWLSAHKYPINLDPTIEISVLNVFSHPDQGDDWIVDFRTIGTADLTIAPNDQATVVDDEFVSLWCDNEQIAERRFSITDADVIIYRGWSCAGIGRVIHNTLKAGNHTLRFQFGDEISYAYNHFLGDRKYAWSENAGWISASTTHERITASSTGITGYAWGENIGWLNFDYDSVPGATNSSSTDWGVINDGAGNLGGYAWGENIGWVNFHASSSQVRIDADSGKFSGFAWSQNIGWINFGHTQLDYIVEDFGAPYVNTKPALNISADVLTAVGFAYRHGYNITRRGFKYGTTTADTWEVYEDGTFPSVEYNMELPNLVPETTYYYRAFAVNSDGTTYGEYVQVTTEVNRKGSPVIFNNNVILKGKVIVK